MTSVELHLPPAVPDVRGPFLVDRTCRAFEREWRRGLPRPRVGDWVEQAEGDWRDELRQELIAVEIELRLATGDPATAAEYHAEYPDLTVWIDTVFADSATERATAATPQGMPFTPTRLGDYRIIREIGRGGMGVVFEAVQESLGRRVAIKCLSTTPFLTERHLKRFRQEARAIAKLHHSHIVEVYGLAVQNGLHYFAMQFVDGCGLDEVIGGGRPRASIAADHSAATASTSKAQAPEVDSAAPASQSFRLDSPEVVRTTEPQVETPHPPPVAGSSDGINSFPRVAMLRDVQCRDRYRFVARLGRQIAGAMHYAHSRGVLHRDAKPSNILLDRDGTAWLTDFGLAKIVGDTNPLSDSEDVVGTLRYMAPEMLDRISDERADVYILGLTLYELLTLQPAFPETDRSRLMYQVLEATPPAPRQLNPAVPPDLETIVLKALAREADNRYQTAADLAEDLRRFEEHQPIFARRVTLLRRFARWCQREPVVSGPAVAFAFLLVTGLFSVTLLWRNAVRTQGNLLEQRDVAIRSQIATGRAFRQIDASREEAVTSRIEVTEARHEAEAARDEARRHEEAAVGHLVQFHRTQGVDALEEGDFGRALLWTMQAVSQVEDWIGAGGDEATVVAAERHLPGVDSLRARLHSLLSQVPRPLLIANANEVADRSDAGLVPPSSARGRAGPRRVQFNRDGDQVWISNDRGTQFQPWNLSAGRAAPWPESIPAGSMCMCSAATGAWGVSLTDDLQFQLWNLTSGRLERELTARVPLHAIAEKVSGVVNDEPTAGHVSSATSGSIELHQVWLEPRGGCLLTAIRAGEQLRLWLWDLQTGDVVDENPVCFMPRELRRVEFSRDGRVVALFGDDAIQVRDTVQFGLMTTVAQPRGAVSGLSPNGDCVAMADERELNLLDVTQVTPERRALPVRLRGELRALAFDSEGRRLVAVDDGGAWESWNVSDGESIGLPRRPEQPGMLKVCISPDGRLVAFGSQLGVVRVCNLHTGLPITPALPHRDAIQALAWDDDGRRVAALTERGLLSVWDLPEIAGDVLLVVAAEEPVHMLRFSPSGKRLAVVTDRGAVRLWNENNFEMQDVRDSLTSPPEQLAWSRDGCTLAALVAGPHSSLSIDSPRLQIWDADSQRMIALLDLSGLHGEASAAPLNVSQLTAGLTAWQLAPGGLSIALPQDEHLRLFAVGGDAGRVAIADASGNISIFSNTGREIRRWPIEGRGCPTWLGFNPSSRLLAAAGDRWFRAWDIDSGRDVTADSPIADSHVETAVFSKDGLTVLLVTDDVECQVWSTLDWRPLGPALRVRGSLKFAGFNCRGDLLVTVSELGQVGVWDWRRGEPVTLFRRTTGPIVCADLHRGTCQLALGGLDGSVRIVDLAAPDVESLSGVDLLVAILSGSRIDQEQGLLFPLTPTQIVKIWDRLRALRLDLVRPNEQARQAWHLRQLDEARLEQDYAAQLFHLERVSAGRDES
jgi:serine/threonine protein kinase/WD40 repeat protein